MIRPDPKFAVKDKVSIKFDDRIDHGVIKSRTWSTRFGEWQYHVERQAYMRLGSGETVPRKGEKTGWAGVHEDQLIRA